MSRIGELNTNWSQMRDFIDKVWDKLSEVDQKFLLERLRVCLKGKEIQGVNDSRILFELLVLEERGYISIVDKGIVYQISYMNEQLKRPDISKKELEDINRLMELIFVAEKKIPLVAWQKEVDALERIHLEAFILLHKEEIMAEYRISDEEVFHKYMEGSLITLELWQTEYRQKVLDMESLSREEFLDTYPLGTGTPKDDMLFLGQMVGYSKEERLLILQEVKKGKGISSKKLAEIVGGTYKGIGYESSRISMAYQGSRGHMSMGEIAATATANGIQQVQTAFNMAVMPVALQAIYDNINPLPSNVSLDPIYRLDKMEVDIRNNSRAMSICRCRMRR